MSARAIGMFIFWVILSFVFAYYLYDLLVLKPQEEAAIDAKYEAELAEYDRKILEIDREYCMENPDDGSGYYKRHCDQFK